MPERFFTNILNNRLISFRKHLDKIGVETAIITDEDNCYYFSGFRNSNSVIVVDSNKCHYLTDFRYFDIAHKSIPHMEVIMACGGEVWEKALQLCHSTVGIPFYSLTHDVFLRIEDKLHTVLTSNIVDIGHIVKRLRSIKDSFEISQISKALSYSEEVLMSAFKIAHPFISEKEISNHIVKSFINLDCAEAFETIVAFSENAANCHAIPQTNRKLSSNLLEEKCCLIDMGAKRDCYCSDLTRTVLFTSSDKKLNQCFDIVNEANLSAIDAIKPGVCCSEIDQIGRNIISRHGYGDFFGHSIGHGVGLQIHEEPFVSRVSTTVLEPGMVITIEPGIYINDSFGIRIENMVLVTEAGHKVLTKLPNNVLPLL